jgi:hypothetical protein
MDASFTTGATSSVFGGAALTVQWYASTNGGATFNPLSGATGTTFTVAAAAASMNNNRYHAVFTDPAGGTATTNSIALTVNTPPVVTVNPQPLMLNVGATATFMAAATGTPAPTVQWYVSTDSGATFNPIPGATSTPLTFIATAAMSGNLYKAVFTNACGVAATDPPLTLTVTTDNTFQMRYTSNLNLGDSYIDITNTGASSTALQTQPVGNAQVNINGSICVNIYAFAADEQEVSCCSCLVTPNGLYSLSVRNALLDTVLPSFHANSLLVKLISTAPSSSTNSTTGLITQTCNPATISTTAGAQASGMLAWGTTLQAAPAAAAPYQVTETPFLTAALSSAELARDVTECQFIQILFSGQAGICKGCQNFGLGAEPQ